MKCKHCNKEVGGLVPLSYKQIFEIVSDRTRYSVEASSQVAEEICSRFGTPKEKVELDEKEVQEIIENSIVGKSALENWGAKGYAEFMEIGNIAHNRFNRLAKSICAKFSIPKTSESLNVNRKLEIADIYYKDGYRNGYIEGFNKALENQIKKAELSNEPIIIPNPYENIRADKVLEMVNIDRDELIKVAMEANERYWRIPAPERDNVQCNNYIIDAIIQSKSKIMVVK